MRRSGPPRPAVVRGGDRRPLRRCPSSRRRRSASGHERQPRIVAGRVTVTVSPAAGALGQARPCTGQRGGVDVRGAALDHVRPLADGVDQPREVAVDDVDVDVGDRRRRRSRRYVLATGPSPSADGWWRRSSASPRSSRRCRTEPACARRRSSGCCPSRGAARRGGGVEGQHQRRGPVMPSVETCRRCRRWPPGRRAAATVMYQTVPSVGSRRPARPCSRPRTRPASRARLAGRPGMGC